MNYGYSKSVNKGFEETVERVTFLLKEEGFGVLCDIDASEKINTSLGKNMEQYKILGACNPNYAYHAIEAEKEIGLLLPCNIIVYINDGITYVSTILPNTILSITGNEKLSSISEEVESTLKSIIDNV